MIKTEAIKHVLKYWNTRTSAELSSDTGFSKTWVTYNAGKLRKLGFNLASKKAGGVYTPEFIEELKKVAVSM